MHYRALLKTIKHFNKTMCSPEHIRRLTTAMEELLGNAVKVSSIKQPALESLSVFLL